MAATKPEPEPPLVEAEVVPPGQGPRRGHREGNRGEAGDTLGAAPSGGESGWLRPLARTLGVHPLVGFGLFALDWMLFSGELFSGGVAVPITILLGVLFTIPAVLIQRFVYGDGWGAAAGKGLLLGLLTAVPTALPSVVPAGLGTLGIAGLLPKGKDDEGKPLPKEQT